MRFVFAEDAVADLARLHTFLAEKSPVAADRAVSTLMTAIQSLETFPERGRPSSAFGIRELIAPYGRYQYVIRYAYRVHANEIVVLRVWHGREERE